MFIKIGLEISETLQFFPFFTAAILDFKNAEILLTDPCPEGREA